ncbi:MAG: hypothetical protein LC123_02380 [Burkholderiales bacterium]|nr:hypothetical protein [Burkholderiales bacterium]
MARRAVDRGGLRYPIEIVDSFTKPLADFRQGLASAETAFKQFRQSAATGSGFDVSGIRSAARAFGNLAKARRDVAEAETLGERATAANNKMLDKALLKAEQRRQAEQLGIGVLKQKLGALTDDERAEARIAKTLDRRRIAERAAAIAAEHGIDIGRKKVEQLTVESAAIDKVAKAHRKAQIAEKAAEYAKELGVEMSQRKAKALTAEAHAAEIAAKAKHKLQVAEILAAQGLDPQGRPIQAARTAQDVATTNLRNRLRRLEIEEAEKALKRLNPEFAKLAEAEARASREGNSLFFTFRRLIGVFAAFALIRNTVAGFQALLGRSIEFAASIEQAELGLASLFAAVGQVRDEQGRVVEGAEAFAIAQTEARRQMALLRRDALTTAATFEELTQAFQQAIGPGLAAGLNLDQIRTFAVRVSQAASALGVAQNQLGEEIRALLTGNIQSRTTRLGVLFPGGPAQANEEIKRAREMGTLAQLLEERFQTFARAGEAALLTFNALFANVKGALDLVLASGADGLFNEIKRLLQDVLNGLAPLVNGEIVVSERAVQIVRQIADGLREGVEYARELIRSLDARNVEALATVLGDTLAIVLDIAGIVVDGIVQGLGGAARVAAPTIRAFREILDSSRETLGNLVGWAVQIGIVTKLLALSRVSFGKFTVDVGAVRKELGLIANMLASVAILIGLLLAPLGLLQEGFRNTRGEIRSLSDSIRVVSLSIYRAFLQITTGLGQAPNFLNEQLLRFVRWLETKFADAINYVAGLLKALPESLQPESAIAGLEKLAEVARSSSTHVTRDLARVRREQRLAAEDAQVQIDALDKKISELEDRPGSPSLFRNPIEALSGLLDEVQANMRASVEKGVKEGADAAGSIAGQSIGEEVAKGIRDAMRDAVQAQQSVAEIRLQVVENLPGLDTLTHERLIAQARAEIVALRQRDVDLQVQGLAQALQLAATEEEQIAIAEQINALREKEALTRRQEELERNRSDSDLAGQIALARAEALAAGRVNAAQRTRIDSATRLAEIEAQALVLREQMANKQEEINLLSGQAAELAQAELSVLQQQGAAVAFELERQRAILSDPVGEAFESVFGQFRDSAVVAFEATTTILRGVVSEFSSFVSESIVDAFDPNSDASLLERFSKFLQNVLKMVIDVLVQIAIMKSIVAAIDLFGFGAGTAATGAAGTLGGLFGFAEGGKATPQVARRARPTRAHRKARGYAQGGSLARPAGLDPRDRIPVWVRLGEWMIRPESAGYYGDRVMSAINAATIPRPALEALASSSPAKALRVSSGPGFALGGPVRPSAATAAAGSVAPLVLPAIPANDRTMEELLTGGMAAVVRFFGEHSSVLRGALGVQA